MVISWKMILRGNLLKINQLLLSVYTLETKNKNSIVAQWLYVQAFSLIIATLSQFDLLCVWYLIMD